ncbi:hypothetical protein [Homoserinibacter sp. YIM 151385]|uniref:hypothetical protein n=1 Tax=Homoserinibacter sp. YIM 151385 TaxID=2985506 RepID=UPI0022F05520|nr:hypothetical protein [Homoserinibacter sp. YIM 151385]WBU37650.1 hypothetical protein OF852_12120 [Homoserinibacter sp. YIM 151385]
MMTRIRQLARLRRSDHGIALPSVFGLGMIMLVLVASSMTVATSGLQRTDQDEDWNAALNAARAGVQEYQSRLANDNTYTRFGNPQSKFTKGADNATDIVAPPASQANPAFGINGAWATMEGTDGRAQFRYEINTDSFQSQGRLQLRSTGKVGSAIRSIVADLKQDGFINFLYLTRYEIQDPQFSGQDQCGDKYSWGSSPRPSGCAQIQFGSNSTIDTFNGPVHSNDSLAICNAAFNRGVTSSATPTRAYRVSGCTGSAGTTGPASVSWAKEIGFPATNASDRRQTYANDPDITRPGCLYTGPTKITWRLVGSTPKMTIISPWTKATNPYPGERTGTSNARCGNVNQMHTSAGAEVDALHENLIFIQDVPTDTNNVNGWATGTTPRWTVSGTTTQVTCGSNPAMGGWTFGSHGYPSANESAPEGAAADAVAYGCRKGDLFTQGVVGSAVTMSAENYAYITGDLTNPTGVAEAMTGVVGNNGVIIRNPVRGTETCTRTDRNGNCTATETTWSFLAESSTNRTIDAALMSVQHTIQVQNYTRGQRGTLKITGSMAQKYRGPTGTTAPSGYTKNYNYDARFLNTAPPKFLTPTSTTYGVTQTASTPSAWNADGSSTGR